MSFAKKFFTFVAVGLLVGATACSPNHKPLVQKKGVWVCSEHVQDSTDTTTTRLANTQCPKSFHDQRAEKSGDSDLFIVYAWYYIAIINNTANVPAVGQPLSGGSYTAPKDVEEDEIETVPDNEAGEIAEPALEEPAEENSSEGTSTDENSSESGSSTDESSSGSDD